MKVLLINKFLYPKGGAEISTLTTGNLLSKKGHEVFYWGMDHPENPDYPYKEYFVPYIDFSKHMNILQKFRVMLKIWYSLESKRKIEKLIKIINPDIVHLNNIHHHLSPSILDSLTKRNIPVVMTLRDYKIVCPCYYLMRPDGVICEKCKGGKYYFCFLGKCTKGSFSKSLINTVEMYIHHKILHIFDKVDLFISPSLFLKNKLREMGFTKGITCLPNFVDLANYSPQYRWKERSVVYFGRLSHEKGLTTLLEAVKGLNIILKIIGDGPIRRRLEQKVSDEKINNVEFMGYKSGEELKKEIKSSIATVLPSEWNEPFGRAIIESFALGKPVIGARIGGIPELVKDGQTGYTFEPGNAIDLRAKIECLVSNHDKCIEVGKKGRRFVEENFGPERHYLELMGIYQQAIEKHK